MIYKLLALRGSDDPELKARDEDEKLSAMTWATSRSFEAGDLRAAILAYQDSLKSFPDDPVTTLMQVEIEDRLSRSPPEVGRLAHYGA
jgi:hypothetical protein